MLILASLFLLSVVFLVPAASVWNITSLLPPLNPISLLQITSTTILLATSSHLHHLFINGTAIWSILHPSQTIPFDLCYIPTNNLAFLLVVTTTTPTQAQVLQYPLSPPVTPRVIYSTPRASSNVKLFSCAVYRDQIFATGGTSSSLFTTAQGLSDIITLQLSPQGDLIRAKQFGTSASELGRAVTASDAHVAIAAQRDIEAGIESVLYLLHPETFEVLAESVVPTFGSTPLFIPVDVVLSTTQNVETAAVIGTALVVPDRRNDVFIHLFAGESREVAVYKDDQRGADFGVGVKAGEDGNFYVLGGGAERVLVTVISPAGKTLLEEWQTVESDVRVLAKGDTLFFGGAGWLGSVDVEVEPFEGFGDVVDPATTDPPDPPAQREGGVGIVGLIGAAVGGATGMIVVVLVVVLVRRKRDAQRESPAVNTLFTSPRARLL